MDFGMPFLLENQTVEDAAALCSELDLRFVELNLNFPACSLENLDVQELYRLKRKYGVYFTIHLEEDCNPFAYNSAVRRAWLESIRKTLILAQAVHAPVVNMHLPKGIYITLPEERVYLFKRYADEYRLALSELKSLCEDVLTGSDTRMAIENTDGFAAHEQEAVAFLLESPVFGLTLDIGHSHAVGNVDEPFYEQYENRLIHMHGHDALGKNNHLALGDGEIDLVRQLRRADASGARVVLETKTIRALRTSVAWLEKYL